MQRITSKGRAGPPHSLFRLTLQVSDIMEGRQALEMTLPVLSLRWVDGCHWQPNLTNVCLLSLRTPKQEFRAPPGVRKSPKNEPAGRKRWSMGISVFG
jgi:hypothetical protein